MSELTIQLSPQAYDEVRRALKIMPGYERFKVNGPIYFEQATQPAATPHADAEKRKKLRNAPKP